MTNREYDALMDAYGGPHFQGYADPDSPRGRRLRAKHATKKRQSRSRRSMKRNHGRYLS